MRRLLALPLLLLAATLPAQEAARQAFPPADDEPTWSVGVAAFIGRGLSAQNRYLTHSLALGLRERLTSARLHFFGEEERRGYQAAVIRRAIRQQGAQLEALRRERDALFFQDIGERELRQKQEALDARLRQAADRLVRLQALDPGEIAFPEKKEILFQTGSADEALFPPPAHSALQAARLKPVNLLVWGRLEEVQGSLYFEVRAIDAAREQEVFSYSDASTREQLAAVLEPAVQGLLRLLWGQERASIGVQVTPPEARIYLDGTLLGSGQAHLEFVEPGEKELRVELEGYETQTRKVSVSPYSFNELAVELEPRAEEVLLIRSDPPGAALYRDSTWLGTTPLSVPRPDSLSRFLLREEGYLDLPLYLGPGAQPELNAVLPPVGPTPAERQKRDRNRFYTAFGLFALSLPLPIFGWGLVNDYATGSALADLDGQPDDAQRLYDTGNTLYYAFWGSVGLSAGLAVNMLFRLVRYLRSADRKA